MRVREAGAHIDGRLLHFEERIAPHLKERVRSRAVRAGELERDRKSHDAFVERVRLCVIADSNSDETQAEDAVAGLALSGAWLHHETRDDDPQYRCEERESLHLAPSVAALRTIDLFAGGSYRSYNPAFAKDADESCRDNSFSLSLRWSARRRSLRRNGSRSSCRIPRARKTARQTLPLRLRACATAKPISRVSGTKIPLALIRRNRPKDKRSVRIGRLSCCPQ